MNYCKKCGAYIPMEETACPACGYDPDAEAKERERQRLEEEKRAAEAAEREREEARRRAEAEQERQRAEARRKAEEAQHRHRTSYRTGGTAAAGQTASRRAGAKQEEWKAPWTETASQSYDDRNDYRRAQARDSASNQGLSVLSYFGPLFLIPLLLRSDDSFARFHANQGLVLLIFEALVKMVGSWIPLLGGLVTVLGGIFAVYCVICGVRSVRKGRKDKLPLIGNFKIL